MTLPSDQRSSKAINTNITCDIIYIMTKAAFTSQKSMNSTILDMNPPIFRKAANPTAVPTAQ